MDINKWVSPYGLRVDAPVRLFCFAHAGGGGTFFRSWQPELAPEVAVVPVILPGRESRAREAPYRRISSLIGPLAEGLAPYLDRPYAFFGHSLGAIVAFEAARRLVADGHRDPLCLFVSGRRAPHLPTDRQPLHALPDDQFIAAMAAMGGTPPEVLDQRELLDAFLPRLRADFELNETYVPLGGPRLTCPVSALTGDADTEVDPPEMAAWQVCTDGEFILRVFHGGHFYLSSTLSLLLATIRVDLSRVGLEMA